MRNTHDAAILALTAVMNSEKRGSDAGNSITTGSVAGAVIGGGGIALSNYLKGKKFNLNQALIGAGLGAVGGAGAGYLYNKGGDAISGEAGFTKKPPESSGVSGELPGLADTVIRPSTVTTVAGAAGGAVMGNRKANSLKPEVPVARPSDVAAELVANRNVGLAQNMVDATNADIRARQENARAIEARLSRLASGTDEYNKLVNELDVNSQGQVSSARNATDKAGPELDFAKNVETKAKYNTASGLAAAERNAAGNFLKAKRNARIAGTAKGAVGGLLLGAIAEFLEYRHQNP